MTLELIDAQSAHQRIAASIVRTPLLPVEAISQRLGCSVWLKAENLQAIGAFKARGATNAIFRLSGEAARCGVVTHSSGNHAAAVARAATLRHIDAHIVMPHNSSPKKMAAVRSFGIEPVVCEPDTDARRAAAESLQKKTGATMIHPYDNFDVMAGQATVGLEILEDLPDVDAVVTPVGGGGLAAGILTAVKSLRPDVQVYGVEPAFADDTARSLNAGTRQKPERYDTVADGLRTQVGELTFPIIQKHLDDLWLVSENEILSAMRMIAETAHLVVEPSGAVGLAGVVQSGSQLAGKHVAIVLTGGNVDMSACSMGRPSRRQ
ncbi:MAG: threonine/serine dehydratase [Planctomycetota bacterium]